MKTHVSHGVWRYLSLSQSPRLQQPPGLAAVSATQLWRLCCGSPPRNPWPWPSAWRCCTSGTHLGWAPPVCPAPDSQTAGSQHRGLEPKWSPGEVWAKSSFLLPSLVSSPSGLRLVPLMGSGYDWICPPSVCRPHIPSCCRGPLCVPVVSSAVSSLLCDSGTTPT